MKNLKLCVLPFTIALLLTACGGKGNNNSPIKLIDPEDTSMLSANCKAYVDDVRALRDAAGDNAYKYHEVTSNIEDEAKGYLDTGDPNGYNQTRSETPDRSDKSQGVELKFEVEEGFEAEEYKVLVSDNNSFENAKELSTSGDSVRAKNLFVNTKYYWKVVAGDKESPVGEFTTGDYPRFIDARPMYNVRDLGGYMTDSGKRVKQGLIYRGGEIAKTAWASGHTVTNSEASKKAFREDMGMVDGVALYDSDNNYLGDGLELDLRGSTDIGDGYNACVFAEKTADNQDDIKYVQYAIKSYEETFTRTRSYVASIFNELQYADKRPVYFHCWGGADRTATIGFLINGLLGVSYEDLVIDFELTSYSSINNEHIRNHLEGHQHSYDRWPALINQIKTDTTGGYAWDPDGVDSNGDPLLLKGNIYNFLNKACGVPTDTLDTIRSIMLED